MNRTMTNVASIVSVLAFCAAIVLGGCASKDMTLSKAIPWTPAAKKKYETPERVIAVWSDAVYQLPGKPPSRGFGGRIYFYNREGQVIPVDGQLMVYAYDDTGAQMNADTPSRKYAFTAEQLTHYYSESDLGASYNIWIPWDSVGGEEKQISLFPVFVDDSGRMVRGSFANNRLPGKRDVTEQEKRGFYVSRRTGAHTAAVSPDPGVTQVGYQEELAAGNAQETTGESGLRTHTIRVPRSLSDRMAQNAPHLCQRPSPRRREPEPRAVAGLGPTSRSRASADNGQSPGRTCGHTAR